jgi:hypothetical protein
MPQEPPKSFILHPKGLSSEASLIVSERGEEEATEKKTKS